MFRLVSCVKRIRQWGSRVRFNLKKELHYEALFQVKREGIVSTTLLYLGQTILPNVCINRLSLVI